jgi:NAD(P)-dependent dehydrogenase (short-subunit alcohol dehydrogenase family)
MYRLENKRAFITGATSGIGLAIAKNFTDNGAEVYICGRRDSEEQANEIGAKFLRLDVTSEEDFQVALQKTGGGLDIVVLNAGIAEDTKGLVETPSSVYKKIIEVNLNGVYYGLKYCPKYMNDGGSIIVTGSAAGSGITTFGYGEYSASKAGAAYLARTSAIELASRRIRVNVVAPASIADTGMMVPDDGSDTARFYAGLTALGRMGSVDEVVPLYNFLAGEGSTFITGQEICIDGGMTTGFGMNIVEKLH